MPYFIKPVDLTVAATNEGELEKTGPRSASRTFTFVGDAHIHGIMHGEHYDARKLEHLRIV